MNIEEAVQKLEFVNRYKTYKDTYSNMELDAIETVLNELDKDTETINNLINEVTIKDAEITQLKKREWLIKYKLERDVEIYSQDGCCRKQVRKGIVREAKEILELLGDDVNEH